MSRRRTNPLEQIIDRMAQWPWWAGVLAALLSWIMLFGVTRLALPAAPAADFATQGLAAPVLQRVALAGQFVLPLLFLGMAALSAWLHYRHERNYADMHSERGRYLLQHLSWREFEDLVAEFFRRKGFSVEQRGRKASDGGVDLVARIGEDRYLVQCKHWRVQRVGVAVVRALCRAAEAEGAAGVFVVTSGSFTDEARQFVQKNRIAIELITGEGLRQMIRGLQAPAR
jgi:restriction system protein